MGFDFGVVGAGIGVAARMVLVGRAVGAGCKIGRLDLGGRVRGSPLMGGTSGLSPA